MTEADSFKQYHLIIDVSKYVMKEVLFQLIEKRLDVEVTNKHKDQVRIIMFLFFKLKEAETRYHIIERKALAMIRELAEVK